MSWKDYVHVVIVLETATYGINTIDALTFTDSGCVVDFFADIAGWDSLWNHDCQLFGVISTREQLTDLVETRCGETFEHGKFKYVIHKRKLDNYNRSDYW